MSCFNKAKKKTDLIPKIAGHRKYTQNKKFHIIEPSCTYLTNTISWLQILTTVDSSNWREIFIELALISAMANILTLLRYTPLGKKPIKVVCQQI